MRGQAQPSAASVSGCAEPRRLVRSDPPRPLPTPLCTDYISRRAPRAPLTLARPAAYKSSPAGGGPTRASRRAVVLASLRAVTWRCRSAPRLPASPAGPVSPRAATPP